MEGKNKKSGEKNVIQTIVFVLVVLAVLAVIALIPWGIEVWIFRNNIYSVIGNKEWASFLGSYVGGAIGGIGTLLAVVITTNQTRAIQKKNEQQITEDRDAKKKDDRRNFINSVIEDVAKFLTDNSAYKEEVELLNERKRKIAKFEKDLLETRNELNKKRILLTHRGKNMQLEDEIAQLESVEKTMQETIIAEKQYISSCKISREKALEGSLVLEMKLKNINEAATMWAKIEEVTKLADNEKISYDVYAEEANKIIYMMVDFAEKYINENKKTNG